MCIDLDSEMGWVSSGVLIRGLETSKKFVDHLYISAKIGYFTRDDFFMAAILFSISFHSCQAVAVVGLVVVDFVRLVCS